jgi:hypothetical protein
MPKLKALLACEKVIFDQDGPVSLIGIFQRMNIQLTGVPLRPVGIGSTGNRAGVHASNQGFSAGWLYFYGA